MGLKYDTYLESPKIYVCKKCSVHIVPRHNLISKNFRANAGQGYLFSGVVNVRPGKATERDFSTGKHIVRDVSCRSCGEVLGWVYDKAWNEEERYKVGNFLMEITLLSSVDQS